MLAFIHIPKTAGSSLGRLLQGNFGIRHCAIPERDRTIGSYTAANLKSDLSAWPFRLDSISSHSLTLVSDLEHAEPELQFFTFLRDPLSRCISHYQYHLNRTGSGESLESWIENEKMQNLQTSYFSKHKQAGEAIEAIRRHIFFTGITEHFDLSIQQLNRHSSIQLTCQDGARKNVSTINHVKQSILANQSQVALINAHNLEDQAVYDYFLSRLKSGKSGDKSAPPRSRFSCLWNNHSNRVIRQIYYKPRLGIARGGV